MNRFLLNDYLAWNFALPRTHVFRVRGKHGALHANPISLPSDCVWAWTWPGLDDRKPPDCEVGDKHTASPG